MTTETSPETAWLTSLRAARTEARRTRAYARRVSKLERYRAELVRLHRAGASIRELQIWLQEQRSRTRSGRSPLASTSTIHAYLRSLPELAHA
jgi:hypothetical protein